MDVDELTVGAAGPDDGRPQGALAPGPGGERGSQHVPLRREGEHVGPLGRGDQPLPAAPPLPPQLPGLPAPDEPRLLGGRTSTSGAWRTPGATPPTSRCASGSSPSTSHPARSATAATWPTRTSRTASAAPPRPAEAVSGPRASSAVRSRPSSPGPRSRDQRPCVVLHDNVTLAGCGYCPLARMRTCPTTWKPRSTSSSSGSRPTASTAPQACGPWRRVTGSASG